MELSFTVLGSGTSTGVPAIGCDCPICQSTNPKNKRTRCSGLVRAAGRTLLLDSSTDLRQQALREQIDRLDAVLYTHSHADHVHGIDDLRSFNHRDQGPIPIFGNRKTIDGLKRTFGYIFGGTMKTGWAPRLQAQVMEEPMQVAGIHVIPVPLEHGNGLSQGYRIGGLAYLTDCSGVPEQSFSLLNELDLLVIDGLRPRPHRSHFTIDQACQIARRIGAKRTLLTHLSHDVDYERDRKVLPATVDFAWDGLTVNLPPSHS